VSVKDDKRSARPSTNKTTENVENSSTKTIAEQSTSSWPPLGSVKEFARKCQHEPHCRKVCFQTLDKCSKAAARERVSGAMREG
jgi:hypothetical protein